MANRSGLVAVKKTVVRDGKTYITTVWVKPGDVPKTQKSSNVDVPDWHFKDSDALESTVGKINAVKDPAAKKVLKEHLVADLRKNGIDWKQDTGAKADDINWMRALMAAKKHLKAGNRIDIVHKTQGKADPASTQTPAAPTPTQKPSAPSGKPVLGTGQAMSKDDAKKAVADLRAQLGVQGVMDLAEKNGIQWAKNANHVSNSYMQCAMKLSKHIQAGGVLTDGIPDTAQAKPTVAPDKKKAAKKDVTPTVKPDKNAPKPGTIEHVYDSATPHMKLVAMATGIIPTDEATKDYMIDLIKTGKFELSNSGSGGGDSKSKLPKAYGEAIDNISTNLNTGRTLAGYISRNPNTDNMFKGSPYEKMYNDYFDAADSLKADYGPVALRGGVDVLVSNTKTADLLFSVSRDKPFKDMKSNEVIDLLIDDMKNMDSKEASDFYDKYELGRFLTDHNGSFSNLVNDMSGWYMGGLAASSGGMATARAVEQGSVSKAYAVKKIINSFESSGAANKNENKTVGEILKATDRNVFLSQAIERSNGAPRGAKKEFMKMAQAVGKVNNLDARFIQTNVFMHRQVVSFTRGLKQIDDWKPMDREKYDRASNKSSLIADHLTYLRASKAGREKIDKQSQTGGGATNYLDAIMNGADGKGMDFPEHKDTRKHIRASLSKMDDKEAKKVEEKIHQTHDNVNHKSFKTVVNAVYQIGHLKYEEEFNKIDKARNTTGFYYHGTGYVAAQKIVGDSGQFVVSKKNVKAGRMLGDGVYLANNSSKSMQYASDSYSRNVGAKGVLYVCKASLGNVQQSRVRGAEHNTKLLNKNGIDTVFMDRPDVLNPEWAVKEEKAVLPRLWIDVEIGRP